METLRKLLLSLFACAIAAPVATYVATYPFCVVMVVIPDSFQDRLVSGWDATLTMAPILSCITFAAMVLIGLPVQAHMQKSGDTDWFSHITPAMAGGAFISLITIIGIFYILPAVIAGFIAGSVFWLIRRPDKDEDVSLDTHG